MPRIYVVLVFACAGMTAACSGPAVEQTVRPTAAPESSGLCRPFPDRLIDDFVAAYNGRDLDALESLVTAQGIEDLVAGAYSGDPSFDAVADWAGVSWEADDRIAVSGYGAFHPSKTGFQMLVTRMGSRLRGVGIKSVATTLEARTRGCTVTSLRSSGPVQAKGEPCAFYEAFADVGLVASAEPRACVDGSAVFARSGAVAVETGARVLVWGGNRGGYFTFGDVAIDGLATNGRGRFVRTIPAPAMPPFLPEIAVWTGTEMIVVGSEPRSSEVVAAAYSPASASWRRIAFPFARGAGFQGVWTGRELLLWGGPEQSADPSRVGLIYDPATDDWRKTAPAPGRGRWSHGLVWTGSELVVFGGADAAHQLADGLAYDPALDRWRSLPPAPLSPRQWLPLVWTGREVLVWGGSSIGRSVAGGAAYDPSTNVWRKLPASPLRARHHHSAVWTGQDMIVFGGEDYRRPFGDAAAFDPVSNRWRKLPPAPIGPRSGHVAVWTGSGMLVFGGTQGSGHIAYGDGAFYDPASDAWRRLVPGDR